MKLDALEVLVAGAAIGGAASALLLARAGAKVTLVEKVAEPRAVGAGIALAENGLAVLDALGLGPAIERASRPLPEGRVVDARGRLLLSTPGPAPRARMIRRGDLHEALLDAVAREPRVTTRFGAELVRATADGEVTLRADGATGSGRYDLVLGADGVRSKVREGGAFGARAAPSGIRYLRALVEGEDATGVEAWTAAGLFGSFAVPGGTYFFASAGSRACREALAARDLAALRAAWEAVYPPGARLLGRVARWDDLLVNDVIRVDCERFVDGRLALVGDAAHAMPPNLGQGGNSALVDAAVLLDELRRADALPAALAAYDARRRPAVTAVQDTAARLGRVAEWTSAPARFLRDRVLAPAARRLTGPAVTAAVLQEPTATLASIGRA